MTLSLAWLLQYSSREGDFVTRTLLRDEDTAECTWEQLGTALDVPLRVVL